MLFYAAALQTLNYDWDTLSIKLIWTRVGLTLLRLVHGALWGFHGTTMGLTVGRKFLVFREAGRVSCMSRMQWKTS